MWKMKYWILVYTTEVDNTFHIHRLAREEVKSKYKVSSDEFNFHFFGGFNIQVIVSKFSNSNIKKQCFLI